MAGPAALLLATLAVPAQGGAAPAAADPPAPSLEQRVDRVEADLRGVTAAVDRATARLEQLVQAVARDAGAKREATPDRGSEMLWPLLGWNLLLTAVVVFLLWALRGKATAEPPAQEGLLLFDDSGELDDPLGDEAGTPTRSPRATAPRHSHGAG